MVPNFFFDFKQLRRTAVQNVGKLIFFFWYARLKNSNCLYLCSLVVPSKTRTLRNFFPQICFYFREQRTSRFDSFESMDWVKTG